MQQHADMIRRDLHLLCDFFTRHAVNPAECERRCLLPRQRREFATKLLDEFLVFDFSSDCGVPRCDAQILYGPRVDPSPMSFAEAVERAKYCQPTVAH